MLKACSRCGKIHGYNECSVPRIYKGHKPNKVTEAVTFRGSVRWKHKRIQILQRDNFVCRLCLSKGIISNRNLEVHHIKSIMSGGEKLDDNNLITLCHTCHSLVEDNESYVDTLRSLVDTPALLSSSK